MTLIPAPAFIEFHGFHLIEGRHVFDFANRIEPTANHKAIDKGLNSLVNDIRASGFECRRLPFGEHNMNGTKIVIMIYKIDGVLVKKIPDNFFPPRDFFDRPIQTHYHKLRR